MTPVPRNETGDSRVDGLIEMRDTVTTNADDGGGILIWFYLRWEVSPFSMGWWGVGSEPHTEGWWMVVAPFCACVAFPGLFDFG